MKRLIHDPWLAFAALFWGFAISLVVTSAVYAAPQAPTNTPRISRPNGSSVDSNHPIFEFAPADGTGMTSACACTSPTGSKGETLTFARASSGTCLKGSVSTNIANGDMTTCSTNRPRVMSGGTGVNGLLVEGPRTNSAIRSQELDDPAWTKGGNSVAAPTVTANFAVAPDGTTTAERVQVAACAAGGQYSVVYSTTIIAATTTNASVFCRSNTGVTQTFSLCNYGGAGANTLCVPLTCPVGSWSRFNVQSPGSSGTGLLMGCDNETYTGTSNTGAADILLWGVQLEAGAFASSYIATTSAAVTRATESPPTFTLTTGVGPNFSIAATFLVPSTSVGAVNILGLGVAGAGANAVLYRGSDTAAGYEIGVTALTSGVPSMGTTAHRTSLSDNAGTRSAFFDGVSVTAPAASLSGAQTLVSIGAFGATPLEGVVKQVCVDNRGSGCR